MEARIQSLFVSYLEKSISAEDEEYLISRLNENPEMLADLRELRQIWALTGNKWKLDSDSVHDEWKVFVQKIEDKKNESKPTPKRFLYLLPRVAAIFLFGASVSLFVSYLFFGKENNQLVYTEINTPAGAKTEVMLPDGSRVLLNAGSSIRYSNLFNKKERAVTLIGEAYFNVASNKKKTFLVNADKLQVKAYGTAFNIKSYPEDDTVEATLVEGSIGVRRLGLNNNRPDDVILKLNQRVVYYKSSQNNILSEADNSVAGKEKVTESVKRNPEGDKLTFLISKGIDPTTFTSWKEGILHISSQTLAELAIQLERKYDVKIYFGNNDLRKLKFTGSLKNETVEQVIEAIVIAANLDYKVDERNIWLTQKINK